MIDGSYNDGFDHPTWGAPLRDHARRNFHALRSFSLDGTDTEDADGRALDFDEVAALLGGDAEDGFDGDDVEAEEL